MTDIVEQKLESLRELSSDDLTYKVVRELTGLSHGAIANLDSTPYFDRHDKADIAALIMKNRPILEQWPDISDLEDLLHLNTHIYAQWFRSPKIRKRVGAVKVMGKIRFDPVWYEEIQKQVAEYDEWINADEAINILKDTSLKSKLANVIPYIQPAGKGTHLLYAKEIVIKLKTELDKVSNLITSNEVAKRLGVDLDVVRENISPMMKHPISKKLLYDANVCEQNNDATFVKYKKLSKFYRKMENEYNLGFSIWNGIQSLVALGKLPSETSNSSIYLTRKSQNRLRNIFEHLKWLEENRCSLMDLSTASIFIGVDKKHLQSLVYKYGNQFLLSSDKDIDIKLSYEAGNKKFVNIPRIPYMQWADSTNKLLASPTVSELEPHIMYLREQRPYNTFDAYWTGRLGNSIRVGLPQGSPIAFTFEEIRDAVSNFSKGKRTNVKMIDNLRLAVGYRVGIYDKRPVGKMTHVLESYKNTDELRSLFGYLMYMTQSNRAEHISTIKDFIYNLKLHHT